jgi:hypothetical protein
VISRPSPHDVEHSEHTRSLAGRHSRVMYVPDTVKDASPLLFDVACCSVHSPHAKHALVWPSSSTFRVASRNVVPLSQLTHVDPALTEPALHSLQKIEHSQCQENAHKAI